MANVRVRGVAATAISRILIEGGHRVVQASRVMQLRLGIPFDASPADVTIKDGDPGELVVIGFPKEVAEVVDSLVSSLKYVFVWRPKLNLRSVVVGRVVDSRNGTCIVELPKGLRTSLSNCFKSSGELIALSIVRPAVKPFEEVVVSREITVTGNYVALTYGNTKISFSEHIVSEERRRDLLAIALKVLVGKGIGVRFRSNAAYGSDSNILSELTSLEELLKSVVSRAWRAKEPEIIYDGEGLNILALSKPSYSILDEVRSKVSSTVRRHHELKFNSRELSNTVDYAEDLISKGIDRSRVEEELLKQIVDKSISLGRVELHHVKPSGEIYKLTPGSIIKAKVYGDNVRMIIRRNLRGGGTLNGLGIEKKPGDYCITLVDSSKWFIVHKYHRSNGELLGTYVNINTPPEVAPGKIRYLDLLVDIVIANNGERVVDLSELEHYRAEGIIPQQLYEKAVEALNEVRSSFLNVEAAFNI
ncbi:MAG: DUF402 domain-containing protein [Sulfolobales archaeon]|nr:DUF402 domain-containing protein [Sulfolobales archaeon]